MASDWLTPEWTKELTRIAKSVVSKVDPNLRDDTYQEIWLRFLRYPPMNKSYAWKAANSARDDLWRKETTWRRLRNVGLDDLNQAYVMKVRVLRPRPSISPEERLRRSRVRYHADIERARADSLKRVHAFRLRQKKK